MVTGLLLLALQAANPVVVPTTWTFRSRGRDPITDLESSIASVKSISGQDTLTVQCDTIGGPIVSVLYIPKKFTGTSGSQQVIFRFDNQPPVEFAAEPISDAKAVTSLSRVRLLAQMLSKSQSVFVRAYNYDDQPVDSRFEIAGGESMIKSVFETCKIPYELPQKPKKQKKKPK